MRLPDKGHCHAVAGIQIDEGHHGDTRLNGLRVAAIFKWPGPIHEGNGEAIAFVDRRADEAQRDALLRIMTVRTLIPSPQMFAVYASTVTTMHEPVFTDIDFDVDVEGRRARLTVPDYIETVGEPIRNKVRAEKLSRADRPARRFSATRSPTSARIAAGQLDLCKSVQGQLRPVANLHLSSPRSRSKLTEASSGIDTRLRGSLSTAAL